MLVAEQGRRGLPPIAAQGRGSRGRGRQRVVVVDVREAHGGHRLAPVNAATAGAARPEAEVLDAVDVEVDGAVEYHEEV